MSDRGKNGNLMGGLRELAYSLYDSNGNTRVTPVGFLKDKNLSAPRMQVIRELMALLLNSDLLSEETRLYIGNRDITMNRVNEMVNERIEERNRKMVEATNGKVDIAPVKRLSLNNTISKVSYERKKLEAALGKEFIYDIVYRKEADIAMYSYKVTRLGSKVKASGRLRDNLIVSLPESDFRESYNGDFMQEYGELLSSLLKKNIEKIESELSENKEFLGYFNYLLSNAQTSDKKVMLDRDRLVMLLGGEDVHVASVSNRDKLKMLLSGDSTQTTDKVETVSDDTLVEGDWPDDFEDIEEEEVETDTSDDHEITLDDSFDFEEPVSSGANIPVLDSRFDHVDKRIANRENGVKHQRDLESETEKYEQGKKRMKIDF